MARAKTENKSMPETASDLWQMIVSYAKQETIDPIKGLGRYVAFGLAGSLTLGIGLVLLVVAGLRALQNETGTTFEGNWSWAPYGITLAGCVVVIALALAGTRRRRQ